MGQNCLFMKVSDVPATIRAIVVKRIQLQTGWVNGFGDNKGLSCTQPSLLQI